MELQDLLRQIKSSDEIAADAARRHWNSLAKPLGSLGLLEDALVRIAALTGSPRIDLQNRALLVFCADNGVVAQGVTQTGSEITAVVTRALANGESTVCHMAKQAQCRVIPVDVGILDFTGIPGVLNRRIRNGTEDITQNPAMTREECVSAILTGAKLVQEMQAQGMSLLATGEMGIGNTTTSSAVASVLLGLPAASMTGRGAGLSDAGLMRKIKSIETAIRHHSPNPTDPIDILSKVGGLDLAALCGVFLGGAACRIPVLIDGFISAVAALCALRLCPLAHKALLASHVSAEPAGALVLEALRLEPLITARMRLGEGSGAVAAIPLLDMACAVYSSGNTFDHLGMEAYTPQ